MKTPAALASPLLTFRERQSLNLPTAAGSQQGLPYTLPFRFSPHTVNKCPFGSFLSAMVFAFLSVTLVPSSTVLKCRALVLSVRRQCGALCGDRQLHRPGRRGRCAVRHEFSVSESTACVQLAVPQHRRA